MRSQRIGKNQYEESAIELASLVYPPLFQGPRYLAVICCYCDESYDKDSRIYTIAGFVARDKEWERLSRQWKNRCLKSGLEYYHSSDVEGSYGNCSHLSQEGVISLNTDLVTLVTEAKLFGWATSIVLNDFLELRQSSDRVRELLGPSPYFLAMQMFLVTLCGRIHDEMPNYRVAFVFEEQEEFSGRAKQLFDRVKVKNPIAATCMSTLTYADKKRFVPLQVADKLAYEAMKNILNLRHDPQRAERIALTRMKQAKVIGSLNYVDGAFLQKVIDAQS